MLPVKNKRDKIMYSERPYILAFHFFRADPETLLHLKYLGPDRQSADVYTSK
jgi:hypothetical protein